MGTRGIPRDKAHEHFATWATEDHYVPVHEELAALARAGFAHPECFWRKGPLAIYGGVKGAA